MQAEDDAPGDALASSSSPDSSIDPDASIGPDESISYKKAVPVDRLKLRGLGIDHAVCNTFISRQTISPLNVVEFFHALPYFPIAFTRQQNGHYAPCAVLGLDNGENLFMDDGGEWQKDVYRPAYLRRFPFITEPVSTDEVASIGASIGTTTGAATDNAGADEQVNNPLKKPVFVVEAALTADAPALFIANGVATSEWENIDSFVSEYIAAEQQTLAFIQTIESLSLLEPFDAQIHPKEGDMVRLKGFYRINESKLNQLPAETIKQLMQSGELSRIYAHLISLENFAKLLDRQQHNNN